MVRQLILRAALNILLVDWRRVLMILSFTSFWFWSLGKLADFWGFGSSIGIQLELLHANLNLRDQILCLSLFAGLWRNGVHWGVSQHTEAFHELMLIYGSFLHFGVAELTLGANLTHCYVLNKLGLIWDLWNLPFLWSQRLGLLWRKLDRAGANILSLNDFMDWRLFDGCRSYVAHPQVELLERIVDRARVNIRLGCLLLDQLLAVEHNVHRASFLSQDSFSSCY